MAKRASAVIATSPIEAEELARLQRLTPIIVRRNGLDFAEFQTLPSRNVMRERWHVGANEQLVMYVGRISEKKNLHVLIEAFARAELADARLVIAGPVSEPGYEERLRCQIAELRLASTVLIAGAVYDEEHRAALAAADLFVLPSLNENFGNAAAEAVAANVPVLLTETCGIAPIIHGRAGLAVSLGVESLADGLRQMLDPAMRDQMTARREEVKRDLSWDEPIAQTIALYEQVIRENAEKLKS